MTPEKQGDEPLVERPLDQPAPGERQVMLWVSALFVVSLLAAGWLAARADSEPGVRDALDTILQVALGGLFLGGAYRLLVYYPYRLLDLLVIVMGLSLGLKVALDGVAGLSEFLGEDVPSEPQQVQVQMGPMVLSCLLTSSVLLCGAALGLRYCTRLRLESARLRVAAILYGMLAFPGAVGVFAFPALILSEVVGSSGLSERTLLYLMLAITSCLVSLRNGMLFFRSMALEDEVGRSA
jgi:hypothetical protein